MAIEITTARDRKLAFWGICIVCAFAFLIRFWNLGNFNSLVFDELYYAKFGNNYLTNTEFYNTHPPLSQYIIAFGIWLGDMLPIGRDNVNNLTGSLRSTFSYRWMNALFGSLIPPLVAAVAYQLNGRMSFAFLAALFVSLDGLFLVESRYALNGIYIVVFGLLGQLLVLIASRYTHSQRMSYLIFAGIAFGCAAACKWNGLWFLLGIYLLIGLAKLWKSRAPKSIYTPDFILDRLSGISYLQVFITLTIIPAIVYCFLWIPHLEQNPKPGFIELHQMILDFHKNVKNGANVHPYCADWYTWPLMMRPLAYYFTEYKPGYYHDVHALGNPLLWWFSLGAVFGSIALIFRAIILTVTNKLTTAISRNYLSSIQLAQLSVPIFVAVNYGANLLPWARVSRCQFLYHYVSAVVFAFIGLAWFVDRWLHRNSANIGLNWFVDRWLGGNSFRVWRAIGITTIFIVAAAFIFWSPVYLGTSISKEDLHWRLWDFWLFRWI